MLSVWQCLAIQHVFSRPSLLNFISKDTHLEYSLFLCFLIGFLSFVFIPIKIYDDINDIKCFIFDYLCWIKNAQDIFNSLHTAATFAIC